MSRNFFHTKLFKVVLIIAVFGMLIFLNPYNLFNSVRSVFFSITYPFQKSFHFASYKINQFNSFVSSIGELKRDNERLIKENQNLSAENAMLRDMKKENIILREQLDLAPREKFELRSALVTSQDSHGFGNWLTIDKGTREGIKKGMPVIVSDGILIGRIEEAYSGRSKVILITNPQSSVNAVVNDTNAKGIVKGEFGLGSILDMVLQTDIIQEGNEVVTSGIGEDIPRGLLIGKIQEVRSSEDRLFQQAVITPLVKFSKLRVVFVIKN